jgi:hypothetical protein
MSKTVFLQFAGCLVLLGTSPLVLGASHPATIRQGADSVAMQLHYPPKEKETKAQGAVKFYCEVSEKGKASHISTIYGKGETHFGKAVDFALRKGYFIPATVDGKPTSVMLGGTVVFMLAGGRPTIAVTLATAENDKIATMSNYVQPQMIDSDALFRRKVFAIRSKYNLQYGGEHSGAVVVVHVDSQGKTVSKKIKTDVPPNGGHGRVLLDVVDQEKFIPAHSNGQPVEGDYELAADFEHMQNPDSGPRTGTLLKHDDD